MMTQSLQTQKLPGLGTPFLYSTQGGSYSVQTPYGFQLDLDFLKYVEEIESGYKLRRASFGPRQGARPAKLSQRRSGGVGCTNSWIAKERLSPVTTEEGQVHALEHPPSAQCKTQPHPPSPAVGPEAPPPPPLCDCRVEWDPPEASWRQTQLQNGSDHGSVEQGDGANVSANSEVSPVNTSTLDIPLLHDSSASPLGPSQSSTSGTPRSGSSIGTGPSPDPPAQLQTLQEELGVALQQLKEMEERVRGMVALEREVGELRAERDRLLLALQGDVMAGGVGAQERPLSSGAITRGGGVEPYFKERPPLPLNHARPKRRVKDEGEGERLERVSETGRVEEERRSVAVGDDRPLEESVFYWRKDMRDVAVGTDAVVTCDTGVGTDETQVCDVGMEVRVDTAVAAACATLGPESKPDRDLSALRDTMKLQRESILALEERLGQAQQEWEAVIAQEEQMRSTIAGGREDTKASMLSTSAFRRRSQESAQCCDSSPWRNDQDTQTESDECADVKNTPTVTSRGSQWESLYEDVDRPDVMKVGWGTTADEGTGRLMERDKGSYEETTPFRPPAGVLKSIMKKTDGSGSSGSDSGRKKSLQFVGILNGGYDSTSSEEEEEVEEESSSVTSGAAGCSDSSEGEPLEDTSSEERNISLDDSDSDLEEAERADSDDSDEQQRAMDEKFEFSAEMREACLILKDHLDDDASTLNGEDVLSSSRTLQLEWFRVSSGKSAQPTHVASYLSAFSEVFPGLQEGVVNMTDSNGNTALHYSVSHSNFAVVNLLLDTGVSHVDQLNKAGYTAIMLAALAAVGEDDDMQVVRRLFSEGNVNAKASQAGQTALMLAVSHGRQEMVRALLDCGADVNVQDDEGSTALMCACEHGRAEIVSLLLQHPGCDVSLVDNDGSNALSIALEASHSDIAVLLYTHMNKSTP